MSQGSPFWQGVLFFTAFLFLAWETWRGWRAGIIRSGLHLAAIAISTVVALLAGKLAAMPFGGINEVGGFFAALAVGGGLGFLVFVILWFIGAVLFKRTEQQSSGLFRLIWGAGGAFFGLLIGLAIVWGGISMVRALGTIAQAKVEHPHPTDQAAKPSKLATGLVTLRDSLELGPAGKVVESVDIIPADFYELILQVGKVTSDTQTMLRFIQYPGIQELMENPKLAELVNDPELVQSIEDRNYIALIGNKKMLAAVEDPSLAEQLKKIDLRAALKFALEAPPASPAPYHKSQATSPPATPGSR